MFSIFNYSTLNVQLDKTTRTLRVDLSRPDQNNAINLEMLFELESLFAWCSNKVEIHSIFISSEEQLFSVGFDEKVLPKMTSDQIQKITEKLQKIVQAMFHLPQTIIMDLKDGSQNIASELSIGADIRLASVNAKIGFNHAQVGVVPGSGGMAVLTEILGHTMAKNLLLSGVSLSSKKLTQSGFIFETYDSTNREDTVNHLLKSIHQQAPVQRIQTKLGTFDPIRTNIEKAMKIDSQISKAGLMSEDWKEKESKDRMPSKSMSYSVKLSLVDDNKDNPDLRN